MLVSNWKTVLAKSFTVWLAVAAVVLPEILARIDSLPLTPERKEWLRLVLIALIPFVRIVQQQSLQAPAITPMPDKPKE